MSVVAFSLVCFTIFYLFFLFCHAMQEWYKQYRTKLWDGLCHQEHEMLDCPAAILVVVSSTEVKRVTRKMAPNYRG